MYSKNHIQSALTSLKNHEMDMKNRIQLRPNRRFPENGFTMKRYLDPIHIALNGKLFRP